MHRFTNQVVIITGASSGIGRAMALQLARAGAKVGLVARRADKIAALQAEIEAAGGKASCQTADVVDREALRSAVKALEEALGPCDVMIANAGVADVVRAHKLDAARAEAIYRTNVFGVLNAFEAVIPGMVQRQRGRLVGISSLAAYRSFPETHAYCASKAAVNSQLEGLRLELRSRGIGVTTICPGFIKSEITAKNQMPMPFLMETDRGAERILGAIARGAAVFNFPRRLYWLIKLSRLVPEAIVARFSTPPPGKSFKSQTPTGGS